MKKFIALGLMGCLLAGTSLSHADTVIRKGGGFIKTSGESSWIDREGGINLLAKATPVSDVIRMLPCSIVFENVVSLDNAKVTANLKNASLKEALDAITAQCGLGYEAVNGGTIKIFQFKNLQYTLPVTPISENYQASTGVSQSNGVTTSNGSSGMSMGFPSGNGSTSSGGSSSSSTELSLTHKSNVDLWGNILKNLTTIVQPSGGVVTVDPRSSMVFVRCPAMMVRSVEDYMSHLMDALLLTIDVELTIIDVTTNEDRAFGVDWTSVFNEINATNAWKVFSSGGSSFLLEGASNLLPYTLGYKFTRPNGTTQEVVLKALRKHANIKVVEKTTLQLRNNTAASLRRGDNIPYIDSISTTANANTSSTAVQKGSVLSGVDLGVMASVYKNLVSISVTPRVTQLLNVEEVKAGDTTIQNPHTRVRENLIQVLLSENQTAVVAGAKSSKTGTDGHGIPGLSQIPVIGNIFGYREDLNSGGQIVIMLTPHIHRPEVIEQ